MQTLEQLVATRSSVHLLLLDSVVLSWELEDNKWLEKLKKLPLTVYGDTPSCSVAGFILGISLKKMTRLIRNADLIVPL